MRAVAYARARLRMPAHAYSRSRLCVRARVRTGACMRALHAHACERVRGCACTRTRVIEHTQRNRACVRAHAKVFARMRGRAPAHGPMQVHSCAAQRGRRRMSVVRTPTPLPRSPAPPLPPSSLSSSAQPPPSCWKGNSVQYLARAFMQCACTVSRRLA